MVSTVGEVVFGGPTAYCTGSYLEARLKRSGVKHHPWYPFIFLQVPAWKPYCRAEPIPRNPFYPQVLPKREVPCLDPAVLDVALP